jgi:hypothetical protein
MTGADSWICGASTGVDAGGGGSTTGVSPGGMLIASAGSVVSGVVSAGVVVAAAVPAARARARGGRCGRLRLVLAAGPAGRDQRREQQSAGDENETTDPLAGDVTAWKASRLYYRNREGRPSLGRPTALAFAVSQLSIFRYDQAPAPIRPSMPCPILEGNPRRGRCRC